MDELIVVDTGSIDDTPKLARRYGAKLLSFAWIDDFSAARNVSLERAAGEWLFWMDSDDTIDEANGARLRALADGCHDERVLGYVMQVHCPGLRTDDGGDITVVDQVKLIRNHPGLRFEGRIHEQVLPAIRRLNGEVAWTDIFVVHSGSEHTLAARQRKFERDLRILKLDLNERPDHPFVLFNLGMTYNDMEQHEEAIRWLRKCLAVSRVDESHLRKAYAMLVSSLTRLERFPEANEVSRQGRELFPTDTELWFREGLLAHAQGRLTDAVMAYRSAMRNGGERHFSSVVDGLDGYKARHNLALVYAELERHDLAELQWRLILAERPGYRPALRGLGQELLAQGRLATAELECSRQREIPGTLLDADVLAAELAERRGDLKSAQSLFMALVAQYPSAQAAHQSLCRFLFERGTRADAVAALETMIRLFPGDGAAWHNLANVRLSMGDREGAIAALRNSLAARPTSHSTRQLLEELDPDAQLACKAVAIGSLLIEYRTPPASPDAG